MSPEGKRTERGGCPRCRATISFARTMFGRGKPFPCRSCGAPIVVAKGATSLAVAAFAILSFLSKRVPVVAILLMLVAGALFEWLFARVSLADDPPASDGRADGVRA